MHLIDLDELKKFPIRADNYDKEHGNENFVMGIEAVLEYAENLPTIDAEPVRHGRWIFVGKETAHDGWTYRKYKCADCDFVTVEAKNFCQNCGAKMDGDSE